MATPDPAVLYRRLTRLRPHLRALFFVTLVEAVGRGVFLSGSIVFFTLYAGLTATQVALGVSAAGLAGFVASISIGMLADRVGAHRLLTALLLLQSLGFSTYPLIQTPAGFYAVMVAVGCLEWGMAPTKGALVGAIVPAEERVRLQAQMRTVFNVGFSLGSAMAAIAVLDRSALVLIPLLTALMMLAAAAVTLRLPTGSSDQATRHRERRFGALRDGRFLGVIALSSVQASHVTVLMVVLPLWLLEGTDLPRSAVPFILLANTVVVVLFQVRASRGAETIRGASRTARTSTWWLASGCVLAALTASDQPLVAFSALGLGVLALSIAEIMQAAAGWGLAYGFAPAHAYGEYVGAFGLHIAAQSVVGPIVLSGLVLAGGWWGWTALAVVVGLTGVLLPLLTSGAHEPGRTETASSRDDAPPSAARPSAG